MKSKKTKIIGLSIISLIWLFSLILILLLGSMLYFTIAYKYSMSEKMTDQIKVAEKIYNIQLGTLEGKQYNDSTVYFVEFSNGEINTVLFPGIHNYKPGTQIEMLYRKSSLTGTIEVIDFNADTDSDPTIFDSNYKYPLWQDVKSIEVEKIN